MNNLHVDVSIVLPYRDRREHLSAWMQAVRPRLLPPVEIVVVEQSCHRKFNRGQLLNVGFNIARGKRIIFHDCDLVPDDTMLLQYVGPWDSVTHFGCQFRRYNNTDRYFGGVVGFPRHLFPGFSNKFYGWGGEDDSLLYRCGTMPVMRPVVGKYMDLENLPTVQDKLNQLTRDTKCMDKWETRAADDPASDNHTTTTAIYEARHDNNYNCKWVYCIMT